MRPFLNAAAGIVAAGLTGCITIDIPTDPDTFSVEAAALSQLRRPQTIALNNAYTAETKAPLKIGQNTWVLDLKQQTDTAIVMLRRAMEKQGITAAPQAEKTMVLRLRPLRAGMRVFPGFAQTSAAMNLDVEFGDGTRTTIEAQNTSPAGAQRAFDGAILFALNQLLTDEKFVAYMNR